MYAHFDRLAAELSSSDEGSEDESDLPRLRACAAPPPNAESQTTESSAWARVKERCMALLGATDVCSRDAALEGIAAEFNLMERESAQGLVKFALLPLMMLLQEADKHRPHSMMVTAPPMNLHKDRGIELALAAVSAVVKAGGISRAEVRSMLCTAPCLICSRVPAV
jgi:hypothetical protein